jgi:hypothetical protein
MIDHTKFLNLTGHDCVLLEGNKFLPSIVIAKGCGMLTCPWSTSPSAREVPDLRHTKPHGITELPKDIDPAIVYIISAGVAFSAEVAGRALDDILVYTHAYKDAEGKMTSVGRLRSINPDRSFPPFLPD